MQTTIASVTRPTAVPPSQTDASTDANGGQWGSYNLIRRNGSVVGFEPSKIAIAMTKAFLAVNGGQGAASARVRELVESLTKQVVNALVRNRPGGGTFHIEDVQDQVELALMRSGEHDVARSYVLYREKRTQERAAAAAADAQQQAAAPAAGPSLNVTDNGVRRPLDIAGLRATIEAAGVGLTEFIDTEAILKETVKNLYDGIPVDEVFKSAILSARALVEKDPAYSQVTARLLLHTIRKEVLGQEVSQADMSQRYADYFPTFISRGIEGGLLSPDLSQYDLAKLGQALDASRDLQFGYLGLQTLYDRYFLHIRGTRIELPQVFFMRVAMGLALKETNREARAIEFYEILSSFDFMSSTPTLFNSGTLHSQLSSCYLTTVSDDLEGIYDAIKENALLAKYAGGLGNDWTPVRALRSHIKGTNGESQGVVPFLKVVNDTAVAVNQGGKRKGAVCTYLETWHLDIEEFLELRKNTGDERRRTHDMNTANWIPDLFMKRVMENGEWTLFSPSDCPDLHDKYGHEFEKPTWATKPAWPAATSSCSRRCRRLRCGARCCRCCSKPATPGSRSGSVQHPFAAAARRRGAQLEPVHRDHAEHQRLRNRGVQPGFGEPGRAHEAGRRRRFRTRPREDQAHGQHRHAHARQRDRHQLLRGRQGAQFQPAPPSGGHGHHGLPGLPADDARALRLASRRRIRRHVDGSGVLSRILGLEPAGRGTRPLSIV